VNNEERRAAYTESYTRVSKPAYKKHIRTTKFFKQKIVKIINKTNNLATYKRNINDINVRKYKC